MLIFSIVIAMTVSFTCSLMEAALLSLSLTDIAEMSEKHPFHAKIWKNFKGNIQRPIAVILVINTLAHTIGATISGAEFNRIFGSGAIVIYSLVFSFAMIQWTEILPKTLGVRYNKKLALFTTYPLKFMITVLTPVLWLIKIFNQPFEGKKKHGEGEELNALAEINVLAQFAAFNNEITKEEEKIVSRSIMLSETKVKQIMVKSEEIKFLSTDMKLIEALIEAHIHSHTRYLLCEDKDINKTVGYVNFKDIVSALHINPKNATLKGISRPVASVSVDENLINLLNLLTKNYQHIALVKDKNIVVGLVTLEDVIEAIVGQIGDEYDILPSYFYESASNFYTAGGGITAELISEKTGINIHENKAITLNEWLLKKAGTSLAVEQKVEYEGLRFIIKKMRRSKAYEISIERI